MERKEAKIKIQKIIGKDLRKLAEHYGIIVFKEGYKNKGWAGHVIERHLGLPLNSAHSPNFGSWELKTISLKYLKNKFLTVKETMAITMIDAYNISNTDFENSYLRQKLEKLLIVSRVWKNKEETESVLYGVYEFDLEDDELYSIIKSDYDLVRRTIINEGFQRLTGKMGKYIQPRTKGMGHGSTSRAFYARKNLLKRIIGVE